MFKELRLINLTEAEKKRRAAIVAERGFNNKVGTATGTAFKGGPTTAVNNDQGLQFGKNLANMEIPKLDLKRSQSDIKRPVTASGSTPSKDALASGPLSTGPLDNKGNPIVPKEDEMPTFREMVRGEEEDMFGRAITPLTKDEEQAAEEERRKKEETKLAEQIRKAQERAELAAEARIGAAKVAAVQTGSPTGITAATMRSDASTAAREGMIDTRTLLQERRDEFTRLQDATRRAEATGNVEEALRLEELQKTNLQAQAQLAATEEGRASDRLDTLLSMNPSALSTMDPTALGEVFADAGYNSNFAGSVILSAKQLAEAQKTKDDITIQQAEANYAKTIQGLRSQAEEAVENVQFLDEMLTNGQIDESTYQMLKSQFGAAAKPMSDIDKVNLELKNLELQKEALAIAGEYGGYAIPQESAEGLTTQVNPDGGISINLPEDYTTTGRYSANFKNGDGIYCGEFVNDYFGVGVMGDKFSEKPFNKNIKEPLPGMAFVTSSNMPEGHTGIVLKNFGNGMIRVMDFNKDGKSGQMSVYDMSIQSVFDKGGGFALNPNAVKQKDDAEDATLLNPSQQQKLISLGFDANKTTTYGSLDKIQQLSLDFDITKDDDYSDFFDAMLGHFMDTTDKTLEDAQLLAEDLRKAGFYDDEIQDFFSELDSEDFVEFDFKEGRVVEQTGIRKKL